MTTPTETPTQSSPATRYSNLVYAAALRQTNDPHLAADITQAVFLVLLKKTNAGKPPEEHRMTGWLLQTTRYVINETRRAAFRRHRRELSTTPPPQPSPPTQIEILDLLDTALLSLNPLDRELIARRYLHEEPLDSLASALNLSRNTTTKRITRALEKLRTALSNQGITYPTAAITTTLATQATIHSPTTTATASPLAHHLAHRVLLHSLLARTLTICTIAATFLLTTIVTVYLTLHATVPAATPEPATPPSAPVAENLIHIDKIIEPPSDQLLAQTLAGIRDYHSKLKTLHLDATYTIHWPPVFNGTSADSQTVGTGWIDFPTDRFRMDISLGRPPWPSAESPRFGDDSFTEVWDGAKTRILHGPPHASPRGEIFNGKSHPDGRRLFGIEFSTQWLKDVRILNDNGAYFVNGPFDEHSLSQLRLAARRVIINHHEAVELQSHFKLPASLAEPHRRILEKFAYTYWFDPARGYALLAYQDSFDEKHIAEQRVIDELTEAAPGVFYPAHARIISYARNSSHEWHLFYTGEFHATRVIANQPLDPTLFHLTFPPNISVTDAASSQPATQR
ncbi:MAG: RNA polymerase sigma factor [Phycisphaerae bacterium]